MKKVSALRDYTLDPLARFSFSDSAAYVAKVISAVSILLHVVFILRIFFHQKRVAAATAAGEQESLISPWGNIGLIVFIYVLYKASVNLGRAANGRFGGLAGCSWPSLAILFAFSVIVPAAYYRKSGGDLAAKVWKEIRAAWRANVFRTR